MKELIVKISDFQGPLDLLIHLIKEKKMDILNIDLKIITNDYLNFLFQDVNTNLDYISEYLPTASYLVELQSKHLLPSLDLTTNQEDETEINRQKLIKRILEYKKFKDITSYFQEQAQSRQKIFVKETSQENEQEIILEKNSVDELEQAMINLWKQLKKEKELSVNLSLNLISAEDRALEIKKFLKKNKDKYISLESLFLVENLSLHYFIITFIAILDLAKHQVLIIEQKDNFGSIMIKFKDKEVKNNGK